MSEMILTPSTQKWYKKEQRFDYQRDIISATESNESDEPKQAVSFDNKKLPTLTWDEEDVGLIERKPTEDQNS